MELDRTHPVPGVKTGNFVGLGQGRIVEGVVDEKIHRALDVDHRERTGKIMEGIEGKRLTYRRIGETQNA